MRLRDIQILISEHLKLLNLKTLGIKGDPNNVRIENVFQTISAIKAIEQTKIFRSQFQKIKAFESFFLASEETIILQKQQGSQLVTLIDKLRNDLSIFRNAISEILPDQNEFSISLKLPKITNLKEITETVDKIDKIFNQALINDYVKGEAIVQNFDTGSEWIEILLNTGKAVSIIASIVFTAILLKREKIKNDELIEVVRNRKITNDMIENLSGQLSNNLDNLLEEQTQSIFEQAEADPKDQEYNKRIKYCIKETSKLINKGLQFFPASKAPSELKSSFPDFRKKSIEDMIPKRKEIPEETSDQ
ncbi:MAG: hypothetical protein J7L46_03880 [Bacteroidales bacterium]|nr:hypothetical protein [Bacteroidales bacterium]